MDTLQQREIVVVLGAGRSGTSLAMQMLHGMGMAVSENMDPPSEQNPKGLFEDKDIVALHQRLMEETGSVVSVPMRENWMQLEPTRRIFTQLKDLVGQRVENTVPLWGFKDPRTAMFLPLWIKVFNALTIVPKYILCVRNIPSVVVSMQRQYGFSSGTAEMFWITRNVDALRHTSANAFILHYEDWFTPGATTLGQGLAAYVGLNKVSNKRQIARVVSKCLEPNLNRSSLSKHTVTNTFAVRLYEQLRKCTGTDVDRKTLMRAVDEFLTGMNDFRGWAEQAQELTARLLGKNRQLDLVRKKRSEADAKAEDLKVRLEERRQAMTQAEVVAQETQQKLTAATQQIAALHVDLKKRNAHITELGDKQRALLGEMEEIRKDTIRLKEQIDSLTQGKAIAEQQASESQRLLQARQHEQQIHADQIQARMTELANEATAAKEHSRELALALDRSDHARKRLTADLQEHAAALTRTKEQVQVLSEERDKLKSGMLELASQLDRNQFWQKRLQDDVALRAKEINSLQARVKELHEDKAAHERKILELSSKLAASETAQNLFREELEQRAATIRTLHAQVEASSRDKATAERRAHVLGEEVARSQEEQRRLRLEMDGLAAALAAASSRLAAIAREKSDLEARSREEALTIASLEKRKHALAGEAAVLQGDLDAARAERDALADRVEELSLEKEALHAQVEASSRDKATAERRAHVLGEEVTRSQEEQRRLRLEMDGLAAALAAASSRLAAIAREKSDLEARSREEALTIASLEKRKHALAGEAAVLQGDLDAARAERDALADRVEELSLEKVILHAQVEASSRDKATAERHVHVLGEEVARSQEKQRRLRLEMDGLAAALADASSRLAAIAREKSELEARNREVPPGQQSMSDDRLSSLQRCLREAQAALEHDRSSIVSGLNEIYNVLLMSSDITQNGLYVERRPKGILSKKSAHEEFASYIQLEVDKLTSFAKALVSNVRTIIAAEQPGGNLKSNVEEEYNAAFAAIKEDAEKNIQILREKLKAAQQHQELQVHHMPLGAMRNAEGYPGLMACAIAGPESDVACLDEVFNVYNSASYRIGQAFELGGQRPWWNIMMIPLRIAGAAILHRRMRRRTQ